MKSLRPLAAALGAGALVLAACSDDSASSAPTSTLATADTSSTTTAPAPTASAPIEAPTTTAFVEVPVERSTTARLTATGPGLSGEPIERLDPEELTDGWLAFVSELPGGLVGSTVTVTDQELEVQHELEFDEPPFIESVGWPNRALIRLGPAIALLDVVTGEFETLRAEGGGTLSIFGGQPGQRYLPAVEVGGASEVYLLDLELRSLIRVAGTARSGATAISPDGQWAVAVQGMGPRGAASLEIVRPSDPQTPLLELTPASGEVVERWSFDPRGRLWVTTRPPDPVATRTEHVIDLDEASVEAWYEWGPETGYRVVAVSTDGSRHVLQERSSLDQVVVDNDGQVLGRVRRPADDPRVHRDIAAYIDENDVVMLHIDTGVVREFTAVGSPTPSEIDLGSQGQFWIADGYATGEIGLFRVDLRTGDFVDHRPAVADLPLGEHSFSFDLTRFDTDGSAAVAYQGDDRSWVVRLDADGGSATLAMPLSHRIGEISLSPSGSHAVVISGERSPERRQSIVSVIDLTTMTRESFGDTFEGQRLAAWLPGSRGD